MVFSEDLIMMRGPGLKGLALFSLSSSLPSSLLDSTWHPEEAASALWCLLCCVSVKQLKSYISGNGGAPWRKACTPVNLPLRDSAPGLRAVGCPLGKCCLTVLSVALMCRERHAWEFLKEGS